MPDLSNVANVSIPVGVNVSFNNSSVVTPAQAGPVNVDGIDSAGALSLSAGSLNVATSLQLAALTQSGGGLGGAAKAAADAEVIADAAASRGTTMNSVVALLQSINPPPPASTLIGASNQSQLNNVRQHFIADSVTRVSAVGGDFSTALPATATRTAAEDVVSITLAAGATLQIVNGGVRLPDTSINEN